MTALSPTTGPSAITRPTVPGAGSSGSSSRTRKTVLVCSIPGTLATLTASNRKRAHSTVLAGHRPDTRNPLSSPSAWKGDTSTDRSSDSLMVNLHRGAAVVLMVNHTRVGTQVPLSANDSRDDARVTLLLRIGHTPLSGARPDSARPVTIPAISAAGHICRWGTLPAGQSSAVYL